MKSYCVTHFFITVVTEYSGMKVFILFFNLSYFNTKRQHYIMFYVSFSVKCGFSVLADKTRTKTVMFMSTHYHSLSLPQVFVRNITPRENNSFHNICRRLRFIYILTTTTTTTTICGWP